MALHFTGKILALPDMTDSEFLSAIAQDRFKLWIAFKTFRKAFHLAVDLCPCIHMPTGCERPTLSL